MKCQILFSGKKEEKYFKTSSAENLPRVLSAKHIKMHLCSERGGWKVTKNWKADLKWQNSESLSHNVESYTSLKVFRLTHCLMDYWLIFFPDLTWLHSPVNVTYVLRAPLSPLESFMFLENAMVHTVGLGETGCRSIMKTRLFKYIENFTTKNWKFSDKKNSDIFHISAQNIDYR